MSAYSAIASWFSTAHASEQNSPEMVEARGVLALHVRHRTSPKRRRVASPTSASRRAVITRRPYQPA